MARPRLEKKSEKDRAFMFFISSSLHKKFKEMTVVYETSMGQWIVNKIEEAVEEWQDDKNQK